VCQDFPYTQYVYEVQRESKIKCDRHGTCKTTLCWKKVTKHSPYIPISPYILLGYYFILCIWSQLWTSGNTVYKHPLLVTPAKFYCSSAHLPLWQSQRSSLQPPLGTSLFFSWNFIIFLLELHNVHRLHKKRGVIRVAQTRWCWESELFSLDCSSSWLQSGMVRTSLTSG